MRICARRGALFGANPHLRYRKQGFGAPVKNWLQKDLGGKLGVCLSYISKVENGTEVPSIDLAKKISKVLAPYINKTAFIKKVLEKKGIKEEDIYFFKHLIAKIKKFLKKA